MKVTLAQILIQILPAIESVQAVDLPVTCSYNMRRNRKSFQVIMEPFSELRDDLIKSLAEKDAKGNYIRVENGFKFSPENTVVVEQKLNECLSMEIEISKDIQIYPINFEDLSNVKGITGKSLDVLMEYGLITEPKV